MVLRDFNQDRIGHPHYGAFVATGPWPPTELRQVPRTICGNSGATPFYDLAWFSKDDGTWLLKDIGYNQRPSAFDFVPNIMTGLTRNEFSCRLSPNALRNLAGGVSRGAHQGSPRLNRVSSAEAGNKAYVEAVTEASGSHRNLSRR
ncbi:hypothetical protein J2809_004198 [Arthrobacter pascens]|uniref:hypothetical protein n=1 Tax=Arthrobacter pascens TaxID=1677 RepID=UPI0028676B99|nr:hypothetical protein [Arthrobacter pascens]MDR6559815.1 hypothetical protein [Arthrobacter pascens]